MRFDEALAELDARQPEHMPKPDLSRIRAIAELLDQPQLTFPTVHITGTNGKTTTARLVTLLACTHGLSTGLFTSPHLLSVTERLSICGAPISEEEFGEAYEHLLPYLAVVDARVGRLTYFETLTALAYLWLADKPVSLGVFEVGMGGTWDATNLVRGDVAVLCPIALDHPELGGTIREVATEKAGIIKPGRTAVVREQPPDALRVIQDRSAEYEVALLLEDRDFALEDRVAAVGGQVVRVRGREATYPELLLPMFGEHAARNAAAAIVATESILGHRLDEDAVRETLATASAPGRIEVAGRHPLVILDGAHNPAAARALVATLHEAFTWRTLHLVMGVLSNKDLGGIVEPLAPLAGRGYTGAADSSRARAPEEVASALEGAGVTTQAFPTISDALRAALAAAGEDDAVLVTGSLYTVADARRALEEP